MNTVLRATPAPILAYTILLSYCTISILFIVNEKNIELLFIEKW